MEYLKPILIKKYLATLLLVIGFFVIIPFHTSVFGQYEPPPTDEPCDNSGITATLTYPYNGNNTQALVNRNGGRGNEGIAVWKDGDPKPPTSNYSGDDPYLATDLICGSLYHYEAYTRNNCAGSDTFGRSFNTVSCGTPTPTTVPTLPPPTGLNYTCNPNSTLTVRWNAVSGASGYTARLDYQGSMAGAPIYDWQNLALNDQVAQSAVNNYTFAITYGTRYQWAVSTRNSAGVDGGFPGWNGGVSFSCAGPTATPVPTYQITYNGNGNTGGSVPAAQTKTYNVNLTLSTNTGNLTRAGYSFAGWNTAANGTGTSYAAGGTYAANAAATLYARWTAVPTSTPIPTATPVPTYQITYNGNGNTSGSVPAAQTKTYNVNLTLQNRGTLARTGHTFIGWNTAVNGSGTNYGNTNGGGTYTANAAATMYARWTINTYTVTATGGSNGTITAPTTRSINYNSTTAFIITPNTGYSASATGCGGSLTGTTYTTGPITGDCIVTVTFTINSYPLTVTKSGTGTGTVTSAPAGINCGATCSTNYNYDTDVTLTPVATPNNSIFTGWSGACTGSGTCTVDMTQARSVTATFALLPDLQTCILPSGSPVSRAAPSTNPSTAYTIGYRNNGPGGAGGAFTIRISNSLGSNTTRSVTVPAASATCTTVTIPCNELGDAYGGMYCNESSSITVELDITSPGVIAETNEGNNTSAGNTFVAIASEPFYKLSNASLHRLQAIDVAMPAGIQAYDATGDDTTDPFLIVKGGAGITSATSTIRILPGTGSVSTNNIRRDTYTDANTYLSALSTFTTYANAQKPVKTITDITQVASNTVNVYTGSNPLTISSIPVGITDFVLLVNGNVTINQAPTFNTVADNSVAIIATGTITIDPTVTTVNAILIANSVNLGNSLTNRLKINGNLITNSPTTITRNVSATTTPNVFIVFNPKMYLDLLPHLSDITVEGRQVQ